VDAAVKITIAMDINRLFGWLAAKSGSGARMMPGENPLPHVDGSCRRRAAGGTAAAKARMF
jgi:hypothetical protein